MGRPGRVRHSALGRLACSGRRRADLLPLARRRRARGSLRPLAVQWLEGRAQVGVKEDGERVHAPARALRRRPNDRRAHLYRSARLHGWMHFILAASALFARRRRRVHGVVGPPPPTRGGAPRARVGGALPSAHGEERHAHLALRPPRARGLPSPSRGAREGRTSCQGHVERQVRVKGHFPALVHIHLLGAAAVVANLRG
mmetsp:Transcript_18704/g.59249  ORF Transcript_18704/g.59249 Transcript_18704/m.59249 type:complete len:200 (+) Transcript_18704:385-984(+)